MRRLDSTPRGRAVTLSFEGRPVPALEGEPVACALLAAGETLFSRSVKYHRPRGAFCMAAECSHCLMRVDGTPNLFTCQVPARAGMTLERQNSYPSAEHDVFGAIDWMFPKGLDHHRMFAGIPVADRVMAKVARHLAGLGLLPKAPADPRPPAEVLEMEVAIAGGGAAGTAAAQVLAAAGVPFVLFEREDVLGGRWRSGPPGSGAVPELTVRAPAGAVRLRTSALGLYQDGSGRFLLGLSQLPDGPRLVLVRARRFLLTLGGHAPLLPFENNDLPGVFTGRAASALIRRHGLLPGDPVAIVGQGPELADLVSLAEASGARVAAMVWTGEAADAPVPPNALRATVRKAHGRTRVRGLSVELPGGEMQRIVCEAIWVSLPVTPAFELARQAGAHVSFEPGRGVFAVEADADGRTATPGVLVAGDATGERTVAESAESGRRAARSLAGDRP